MTSGSSARRACARFTSSLRAATSSMRTSYVMWPSTLADRGVSGSRDRLGGVYRWPLGPGGYAEASAFAASGIPGAVEFQAPVRLLYERASAVSSVGGAWWTSGDRDARQARHGGSMMAKPIRDGFHTV